MQVEDVKTKQSCETSYKNEVLVPVPLRFAFFPSHLSKVLRLLQQSAARSRYPLNYHSNLAIWCSKIQPLSGNERPDLLTCLLEVSLLPAARMDRIADPFFWSQKTAVIPFESVAKPSRLAEIHCACRKKWSLNAQKWSEHVVCFMCLAPEPRALFGRSSRLMVPHRPL